MSLLLKAKGISKLSELEIDADKDWNLKGISNIKEIAPGMDVGHIVQHDGGRLVTLLPGAPNHVLTSEGSDKLVTWAPGGMYLWRYFPVSVYLSFLAELFTPAHQKQIDAAMTAAYGIPGEVNPGWFKKLNPAIALSETHDVFTADHSSIKDAFSATYATVEVPVNGTVADDGGAQTDETSQAKSGWTQYENYVTGDDGYKYTTASYWEAQTFTPAANHKLRFIWLKLYRSGLPGTCSVSIKAVDGSGHPAGPDLAQATFNGNALTTDTNGAWYRVYFDSPADINAAVQYAIVLRSATSGLRWRADTSSPTYAGGRREYSADSGTSWISDTGTDFIFEEWGTSNDMTLLPATLAVNDAYYFGHARQFLALILDVGQAGAGTYVLAWEYWNGTAWSALADLNDGTNAFKNAYTNEVRHTPQGDWVTTTIQGMNLYWIRARVTDAGAGYGQPSGTWADVRITV